MNKSKKSNLVSVVTYQLAYLSHRQVSLCCVCVERGDHDLGVLGPVQHGAHEGRCTGKHHRSLSVWAPRLPGGQPALIGQGTMADCLELAAQFAGRKDLRYPDVRIDTRSGQLASYAGPCR